MKLPKRALPCECCGIEVVVSRERLRRLARSGRRPLCEQCRRYVSPGTARMSQPVGETEDAALRLREKRRGSQPAVQPLASMPLGRCGTTGYRDGA